MHVPGQWGDSPVETSYSRLSFERRHNPGQEGQGRTTQKQGSAGWKDPSKASSKAEPREQRV